MNDDDEGGWMAFCDDHIEEHYEKLKEMYKDRVLKPLEHKQDENGEYMKCAFPPCDKDATKELMWMSADISLDESKYVKLG